MYTTCICLFFIFLIFDMSYYLFLILKYIFSNKCIYYYKPKHHLQVPSCYTYSRQNTAMSSIDRNEWAVLTVRTWDPSISRWLGSLHSSVTASLVTLPASSLLRHDSGLCRCDSDALTVRKCLRPASQSVSRSVSFKFSTRLSSLGRVLSELRSSPIT